MRRVRRVRRIAICLLVGLLVFSMASTVMARGRYWAWRSGLNSRFSARFSRARPSGLLSGGAPGAPGLGLGQNIRNLGQGISNGIDRAIEIAEEGVKRNGLGGAVETFLDAPRSGGIDAYATD